MLLSVIDFNKSLTGVRRVEKMALLVHRVRFVSFTAFPFFRTTDICIGYFKLAGYTRWEGWEVVGVALYGTIFGYGVALLAQEDGWKFVQQNSHIAQSDSTSANIHPVSSLYKFHFPLKHPIHFPLLAVLVFSSFFFSTPFFINFVLFLCVDV